jgi:hypothetical protein
MGDEPIDQPEQSALTPSAQPAPTPSSTGEIVQSAVNAVPASGRRRAFKEIRRELAEADLASPGVQKMLLEELQLAEDRCELLETYMERFHDADKTAAILREKLQAQKGFELLFNVSFGIGCAIIGLAPFFWEMKESAGRLSLLVGGVLVIGAIVASVRRR